MRELKVRVWNKKYKRMWDWELIKRNSVFALSVSTKGMIALPSDDDCILEQYIGLRDCKRTKEYPNGQEIYEGDIVGRGNSSHTKYLGVVIFEKCAFRIKWTSGIYYKYNRHIEDYSSLLVLGNIHENSDLLENA